MTLEYNGSATIDLHRASGTTFLTMASSQQPLLRSLTSARTRPTFKPLLFTLSIAAVLSLAGLVTHQLATTYDRLHLRRYPAKLCASSPRPASCRAVISSGHGKGEALHPVSPRDVLHGILRSSVPRLEAAVSAATGIRRGVGDPRERAALADCLELMDLSHLQLSDSSAALSGGAFTDAKTWLSASLTNYDTCLDGLSEFARSTMETHLKPLVEMASAALAVLDAASSPRDDEILRPAWKKFPSWLPARDRRLLEADSVDAIKANAVVALDGSGNFSTVQAAVDSAPNKGKARYVIYVKQGTYAENVNVGKSKTNLMIVGDGMNKTTITGSLNVVDGSTTFNSATLAAVGEGFILQDICIQNTAGPEKHQAVALRVVADKSAINRCKIEAYQDTLYTHSLRQFYRDSIVSGTVDFIFGNAAVVFQNCSLVARKPMSNQQNLVTAQGRTDPNQNTGTSVQNCRVVPSADLAPVKGTIPSYLGRPWKEYSRTVFLQSYLDDHIAPRGWLEWSGTFALDTLFYGEYSNQGPGAGTAGRVNWTGYHVITDPSVAQGFTVAQLIQGGAWLQSTGVVFTEGL
ncbi:hypothetical protein Taro_006066 [Colocasia esculenta]|uniref:Pectinesterase n=1 Tax=Colocasia esculenta TaxID=4460 RepID=A0A843TWJ7_COLES|nr:hypothetical protein [Colocasia esculenta]